MSMQQVHGMTTTTRVFRLWFILLFLVVGSFRECVRLQLLAGTVATGITTSIRISAVRRQRGFVGVELSIDMTRRRRERGSERKRERGGSATGDKQHIH